MTSRPARRRQPAEPAPDRGQSLIEMLIAMMLLGLIAVGTLTALTAAVRGSAEESRLSGARRWLISASDYVVSSNVTRVACTSGESAVRSAYQTAAESVTTSRPSGWLASQITVVNPVQFWSGSAWGSTCYESNGIKLQKITLLAIDPSGKNQETVTVVKLDG